MGVSVKRHIFASLTLRGQTCGLNNSVELDLLVQVQHGNVIVEREDVEFGVHHRLLDLADDSGGFVHVQTVVHAHVHLDLARVEPTGTRAGRKLYALPGSAWQIFFNKKQPIRCILNLF